MADFTEIVRNHLGEGVGIREVRGVGGGDINEAFRIALSDGRTLFVKLNSRRNAGFFTAEEKGLAAIRATGTIQVPLVLDAGVSGENSYLLMEFLDAGSRRPDFWECFGHRLAAMHAAGTGEWTPGGRYGFTEDNYIGAGAQVNEVRESWCEFFRDCRLEAQFRRAERYFNPADRRAMARLLDHLEEYVPEPSAPSLLHGDLWGGNFVTGPDGHAWLIDPAVYVGDAEADLAMTELFGGFAPAFYDAYREVRRIPEGYPERRELYNLYHLLNHLNLFGGGYYGAVRRTLRRFA